MRLKGRLRTVPKACGTTMRSSQLTGVPYFADRDSYELTFEESIPAARATIRPLPSNTSRSIAVFRCTACARLVLRYTQFGG
ncbi:hypothetical protein [Rhodoferax sediminis]|uniref:hypothetical protein n=1 Tax=Rhodoferax sediminis TaxID=2509614 RepID=UPI00115E6173|nr:hypothetical protein [Rhodoferax sediminis]